MNYFYVNVGDLVINVRRTPNNQPGLSEHVCYIEFRDLAGMIRVTDALEAAGIAEIEK